jgi:hypothetical protein
MAPLKISTDLRKAALPHQLNSFKTICSSATCTESGQPDATSRTASPSTTRWLVTRAWPTQSSAMAADPWRATIVTGGWRATQHPPRARAIPVGLRSWRTGIAYSGRPATARFPLAPPCPTAPVPPPYGLFRLQRRRWTRGVRRSAQVAGVRRSILRVPLRSLSGSAAGVLGFPILGDRPGDGQLHAFRLRRRAPQRRCHHIRGV